MDIPDDIESMLCAGKIYGDTKTIKHGRIYRQDLEQEKIETPKDKNLSLTGLRNIIYTKDL